MSVVLHSDREPDRQGDFVPVSWRGISGRYFQAAGIPLLAGRHFGPEDRPQPGDNVPNPPVIIDQTLAGILFPGENAVGRLVTWFLPGGSQCEIVGVVATARDERMDQEPRPRIYRPFWFIPWDEPDVVVRTAGDPAELISDSTQAQKVLGWKPKLAELSEIVQSAWNFQHCTISLNSANFGFQPNTF